MANRAMILKSREKWLGTPNYNTTKKVIFGFLGYPVLPYTMSLSGSTRDFLKLSFHMFPYNEILNVFKSKI